MIGKMNSRVTVNNYTNSTDAGGGVTKTKVVLFILWAEVENRTGQVNYTEGQRAADYDYKIKVRYYTSNTVLDRYTLTYNGLELRINSVQKVDEGKLSFLILRCSLHGSA